MESDDLIGDSTQGTLTASNRDKNVAASNASGICSCGRPEMSNDSWSANRSPTESLDNTRTAESQNICTRLVQVGYDQGVGMALIVNLEKYCNDKQTRQGSKVDVDALVKVFTEFRMQVFCPPNEVELIDRKLIVRWIDEYKNMFNSNVHQYCFVVFMAHGSRTALYDSHHQRVNIQRDIYDQFDSINFRAMVEKPKMFFMQSCRGPTYVGTILKDKVDLQFDGVPFSAVTDILKFCASSPETAAQRDRLHGSLFIQTTCAVLARYKQSLECGNGTMEIREIFQKVSREMVWESPRYYPQTPEISDLGFQHFFLKLDGTSTYAPPSGPPGTSSHFPDMRPGGTRPSGQRTGTSVPLLTCTNYAKVQRILEVPTIRKPRFSFTTTDSNYNILMPFVLQQTKMWGAHILQSQNLNIIPSHSVAKESAAASTLPPSTKSLSSCADEENPTSVHRLDVLNFLIRNSDLVVSREFFRVMSCFPMTLPLVIPWQPEGDSSSTQLLSNGCRGDQMAYKNLIPFLQSCTIRWNGENDQVYENRLFQDKFKLIAVVRIGSESKHGKSHILNQILGGDHKFASTQKSGRNKNTAAPHTKEGTIELLWLTKETCSEELWEALNTNFYLKNETSNLTSAGGHNQVLLLANLHGDCLKFQNHIQFLSKLSEYFICFAMDGMEAEVKKRKDQFESMFSKSCEPKFHYLMVNPAGPEHELSTTDDSTREKILNSIIDYTITIQPSPQQTPSLVPQNHTEDDDWFAHDLANLTIGPIGSLPGFKTADAHQLYETIKMNGCQETKESLEAPVPTGLEIFENGKNFPKRQTSTVNGDLASKLLNLLVSILHEPLPSRRMSILYLEEAILHLSATETMTVSQRLLQTETELCRTANESEVWDDAETSSKMMTLQTEIDDLFQSIAKKSLGLEHLFRRLSKIYESVLSSSPSITANATTSVGTGRSKLILQCPSKVAELLMEGHTIELLDRNHDIISKAWLNSVLDSVCSSVVAVGGSPMRRRLKIFVVSVLGLQSSGKSTLLNALFGCKFVVSAGRCTRGLFLRLMFLTDNLIKELGFDALLVIDTEGMGSPDKLSDGDTADRDDRLLATFVVSISNLTLVNVLGESLKEIKDILEIVIVTMGRLKTESFSPEIMVVRHTTERNSTKRLQANTQFRAAIQQAITTINKESITYKVQSVKALKGMEHSLQCGSLFYDFGSFKETTGVHAPISKDYHHSVVQLFNIILNRAKGKGVNFHHWHERLDNLWHGVKGQDFALRFRNILSMQKFYQRGDAIANIKETISLALWAHIDQLKNCMEGPDSILFMDECQLEPTEGGCESCSNAVKARDTFLEEECQGQEFEESVRKTFQNYIQECKQHGTHLVNSHRQTVQIRNQNCIYLDNFISEHLQNIFNLQNDGPMTDSMKSDCVALVWADMVEDGRKEQRDQLSQIIAELSDEIQLEELYQIGDKEMANVAESGVDKSIFNEIKFDRDSSTTTGTESETPLEGFQKQHLLKTFSDVASHLLRKNGLVHYELKRSLAPQFREMVTNIINEFTSTHGRVTNNFLLVHKAVQIIIFEIKKIEDRWNLENSRLGVLLSKEHFYKKKIKQLLEHDFGMAVAAEDLANCLLEKVRGRVDHSMINERLSEILNVPWLACPHTIRVNYFMSLAEAVRRGDDGPALAHFENPEQSLTSWFKERIKQLEFSEVSSDYSILFKKHINNQMRQLGIITCAEDLFQAVKDIAPGTLQQLLARGDLAQKEHFETFKTILFQRLTAHVSTEDLTELSNWKKLFDPTADDFVMRRLGCTAHCPFCGALCLGQRDHGGNSDGTEKHHTSHQPRGLNFCFNYRTKELLAQSCHTMVDRDLVYWGQYRRQGLKLEETKTHKPFSEWSFDRHHRSEYEQLMNWFFVRLNESIAEKRRLNPCPKKEIESLGVDQNVSLILANILQRFPML